MYSIKDHIKTLRKGLRKKQISAEFVEEFLDNYVDQLESMKEELMKNTQITQHEADTLVVEQCESVEIMIEQVIELYDYQEKKRESVSFDFINSESLMAFVLIFRIFVVFMLFSVNYFVFGSWTWLGFSSNRVIYSIAIEIYSFSGLLFLFNVILIIDILFTKKININELNTKPLDFLFKESFIKAYYRTVLILCLVPVLAPQYIFIDDPKWYYRIQGLISIILTVSTLEWFLKIDRKIEFKQILMKINPLTLFIGYYTINYVLIPIIFGIHRIITLNLLNDQNFYYYKVEYYFFNAIISVLCLLLTYDYWRTDAYKIQLSIKSFSRSLSLWIPLVFILG
ncbi:MAG: hypothetical protein ACW99Q_10905, partial [Candidatus Kariarchaeaceae archaeon]